MNNKSYYEIVPPPDLKEYRIECNLDLINWLLKGKVCKAIGHDENKNLVIFSEL